MNITKVRMKSFVASEFKMQDDIGDRREVAVILNCGEGCVKVCR